MNIEWLKWPQSLYFTKIKNSPAKFFSQSLGQQARLAMLLALVPIIALTLWYAQQVAKHQQTTNHIYQFNQSLILAFTSLKSDVSALEKAQLNNQLLNNAQLQKSIENKWQTTKKNIEFLKSSLASEQLVAKWLQIQKLTPKIGVVDVNYPQLHQHIDALEPNFNQAIQNRLADRTSAFAKINRYFLFGLLLLIPLLIVISLLVIRKVTRQLNAFERVILQLGDGDYTHPIELHGSEEFVALGKELDWLREELLRSHKQKDVFLRHVSHELKTPLASLKEGNSLLQSDSFGHITAPQQRIILIMDKALSRLATLIDDLLNYSAANHAMSHQLCTFEQLKSELVDHFEQQLSSSHLDIEWQNQNDRATVPYLPTKLILTQLIGNALQYAKSTIKIHFNVHHELVCINVLDDGPGIELSEQHKLMQPFYRGKHSDNHQGSGLGLAIVAECVKQLKGTARWQHTHSGAHICIKFPTQGAISHA
ncbi:HAMP domain-containing histidine kinase [Pseudoalteromonas sp. JBTF-M23]|uniref:histidine kinase n=1 Tax=Pseudoalteromonas caenipelagi TaxID=2726988 RepID=A0A849VB69_9GAMM|nr:HAMP domain-containing sensor histidine kinase [Pseudoalteromonas caenipelagi]NOU49843.1 HAMP domain-containing histidine kinase [Pseudoalteromonas caenipelagi]